MFTLAVSHAELAELKRRAIEAGFRNTSDWVRSLTLAGFEPPAVDQPAPSSDR